MLDALEDELLGPGPVGVIEATRPASSCSRGSLPAPAPGRRSGGSPPRFSFSVTPPLVLAAVDQRVNRLRKVDRDPADRVDEVGESREVEDHDVVDVDPEEVLDRLDLQRGAADA